MELCNQHWLVGHAVVRIVAGRIVVLWSTFSYMQISPIGVLSEIFDASYVLPIEQTIREKQPSSMNIKDST